MEFSPGDPNYILVANIIGVVIISLLLVAVRRLLLGISSNKWSPIKARVKAAKIDHETDEDNDTWFKPKVTYGYRLDNGRYIRSSKVSYKLLSTMNYGKAAGYLSGIRVGEEIKIYRNPKKPHQSVVIPGVNAGNYIEIIFFVVFLWFLSSGIKEHREITNHGESVSVGTTNYL